MSACPTVRRAAGPPSRRPAGVSAIAATENRRRGALGCWAGPLTASRSPSAERGVRCSPAAGLPPFSPQAATAVTHFRRKSASSHEKGRPWGTLQCRGPQQPGWPGGRTGPGESDRGADQLDVGGIEVKLTGCQLSTSGTFSPAMALMRRGFCPRLPSPAFPAQAFVGENPRRGGKERAGA